MAAYVIGRKAAAFGFGRLEFCAKVGKFDLTNGMPDGVLSRVEPTGSEFGLDPLSRIKPKFDLQGSIVLSLGASRYHGPQGRRNSSGQPVVSHVWTAPAMQVESDVVRSGCSHVSGLLTRCS
jgi:hypothetical protein